MEILPTDIEQKLERLPIIPFDINEEFQAVINSDDFTDIFHFYKSNYLPEALLSQPELYQRVSLYLTLTGQDTNFVEQTDQILYRRPVPTIEEFLTNNYYHGRLAGTMYPFWKQQLCDIFKPNSPVRKVIFSGCIGSGKSTIARKASVYMLYKILCLRYPRAVYNIDADSTIANFILSVTLKQVYDTNLLPFIKLLEGMPCFQRVMSVRSFDNFNLSDPNCPIPFQVEKSSDTIFFPDNIILTAGSQISHTVGYNICNSFCFTGDNMLYTNCGVRSFKSLLANFKAGVKLKAITVLPNGEEVFSNITNVKITGKRKHLIRLYVDDINYLECTPDHKFLLNNPDLKNEHIVWENGLAYKEAQYLTEEDDVYSKKDCYVYALIDNRQNSKNFGKPFYIGISAHTLMYENKNRHYDRAHSHFMPSHINEKKNRRKNNIIRQILKSNLKPEVKILHENIDFNTATELEKKYISQYGRIIDSTGILTNIAAGGEGVVLPKCLNTKKSTAMKKRLKRHPEYAWSKNKTQAHKDMVAYYNHIRPKVSSPESRKKLSMSNKKVWANKSKEEKQSWSNNKIIAKAYNVIKRIPGNIINENLYNSHRRGNPYARSEPLWKSLVKRFGQNTLIDIINVKYNRDFKYEV